MSVAHGGGAPAAAGGLKAKRQPQLVHGNYVKAGGETYGGGAPEAPGGGGLDDSELAGGAQGKYSAGWCSPGQLPSRQLW